MRRILSVLALLVVVLFSIEVLAADVKVTALPTADSIAGTDIVPVVVNPGTTPVTKKATFSVIGTYFGSTFEAKWTSGQTGFAYITAGAKDVVAPTTSCLLGINDAGVPTCTTSISFNSDVFIFDKIQGTTNPKKLIFALDGATANKTLTFTSSHTDDRTVTLPDATGTLMYTVASSTASLGTSEIASGACASVVSVAGTGIATTDVIDWGFNADPTSTTGYSASANGMLTIIAYPTSGNANFKVCNNTAASITPGAVTLNWKVRR